MENVKKVKIIEKLMFETEDLTCSCGNHTSREGFFPCDENGNDREPTNDWKRLYKCDKCGNVYHTLDLESNRAMETSLVAFAIEYCLIANLVPRNGLRILRDLSNFEYKIVKGSLNLDDSKVKELQYVKDAIDKFLKASLLSEHGWNDKVVSVLKELSKVDFEIGRGSDLIGKKVITKSGIEGVIKDYDRCIQGKSWSDIVKIVVTKGFATRTKYYLSDVDII